MLRFPGGGTFADDPFASTASILAIAVGASFACDPGDAPLADTESALVRNVHAYAVPGADRERLEFDDDAGTYQLDRLNPLNSALLP